MNKDSYGQVSKYGDPKNWWMFLLASLSSLKMAFDSLSIMSMTIEAFRFPT